MSYNYQQEKKGLLDDEGQRFFTKMRDGVLKLIEQAGAVRMQEAFKCAPGSYKSWTAMAVLDRMVELGDLMELTDGNVAGQNRVFVRAN